MSKQEHPANLEPMQAWHDWFLKNERDWSESLARMIKTDAVSKTLGKELNAMLYGQQALAKSMAGICGSGSRSCATRTASHPATSSATRR